MDQISEVCPSVTKQTSASLGSNFSRNEDGEIGAGIGTVGDEPGERILTIKDLETEFQDAIVIEESDGEVDQDKEMLGEVEGAKCLMENEIVQNEKRQGMFSTGLNVPNCDISDCDQNPKDNMPADDIDESVFAENVTGITEDGSNINIVNTSVNSTATTTVCDGNGEISVHSAKYTGTGEKVETQILADDSLSQKVAFETHEKQMKSMETMDENSSKDVTPASDMHGACLESNNEYTMAIEMSFNGEGAEGSHEQVCTSKTTACGNSEKLCTSDFSAKMEHCSQFSNSLPHESFPETNKLASVNCQVSSYSQDLQREMGMEKHHTDQQAHSVDDTLNCESVLGDSAVCLDQVSECVGEEIIQNVSSKSGQNSVNNEVVVVDKFKRDNCSENDDGEIILQDKFKGDNSTENEASGTIKIAPLYSCDLVSIEIGEFRNKNSEFTKFCFKVLVYMNPNLQKLSISWQEFDDECLQCMAENLPDLRDVSFVGCQNLTTNAVATLGTKCSMLRRVDLQGIYTVYQEFFWVVLIFADFATSLKSPKIDTVKNKPYYIYIRLQ